MTKLTALMNLNLTFFYSFIAFLIAVVVGWPANLIQCMLAWGTPITPYIIVKLIGIVMVPVGVVMGWVGFFA